MKRTELEHIIRAAGTIADDSDIVVIGSQAILGQFPAAVAELLVSREADVYPLNRPERWDLIDGSIGEASPFDREFGYYAHGVGPETAVLPAGWRDRLVLVSGPNTRFIRGWCLEPHDLAISKLVAGRAKDLEFVRIAARAGYVEQALLEQRGLQTALEPERMELLLARIRGAFAGGQ